MFFGLHVKCPLILSDFNENRILKTNFRKNIQISNFMKIRPVGAELSQADGQTDMTKIMTALHNIANEPKMGPIVREMNTIKISAFCYTDL